MKKILVLFFLLAAGSLAFAATVDFLQIKAKVDQSGEARVSHLLSIDSRSGVPVNVLVFDNKDIRVFDGKGGIPFTEKGGVVSFVPKDFVENYGATIEYGSSRLTSKKDGQWLFEIPQAQLSGISELKVDLSLPKTARIVSSMPQALVFLGDESLELEWNFEKPAEMPLVSVQYLAMPLIDGSPDVPKDYGIVLAAGALVLLLAVLGAYFFYFLPKRQKLGGKKGIVEAAKSQQAAVKNSGFSERQMDSIRLLGENEEKVVMALVGEPSIAQRNLMAKTGLPKSTLSDSGTKLSRSCG